MHQNLLSWHHYLRIKLSTIMKILFLIIPALFIFSCGSESSSKNVAYKNAAMGMPTTERSKDIDDAKSFSKKSGTYDQNEPIEQKQSKIIKNGQMNIEVDDISIAKHQIDTLLSKYQAYYGNEQFDKSSYQSTYSLIIRVPSKNFEKLISDIESNKGDIKSKNINANDVTESYYDIVTRLENKRAYLKQYQVLLKKANSIKDILEVQEKIRRLSEEIDSAVGRLKYMDSQVDFSTLTLQIYQQFERKFEPRKRHFWSQISRSFKNGFEGFLDFILGIVSIWPFILILLGVWFFRKRINFKFWKKRN